ncbi:hypothetical protein [Hyphococcus sp.]|uniref:hypothetical protein n=1 Tax=Hyphococcus sp. TaxID=2038636 RepID=UPI00208055CF|nr:MAG: hypothetical protein DHS20C04_24130 [Marinicaulis sp.]
MILRRVIAHFRKQEWTAIALDFLIVVVGVFVGLQVSNWNAARQNNDLAASYIERLHGDIELERALWGKTIEYFGTAREYGRAAMAGFSKPTEELDEQWLIALYQASQVWFAAPNRSTFDELQSTGRIVNIRDENLRTVVSNHYQRVTQTGFTLVQSSQYRRVARLYIHEDIQSAVRGQCGDKWVTDERNFFFVALPEHCDIDLRDDLVRAEIANLHNNAEVRQELRFHLSVLDAQIGVMTNASETATATLMKLETTQ